MLETIEHSCYFQYIGQYSEKMYINDRIVMKLLKDAEIFILYSTLNEPDLMRPVNLNEQDYSLSILKR